LGALYNLHKVNPLDYCFNSLSVRLLCLGPENAEYNLIHQYIQRGYNRYTKGCVANIFAVERKGEVERISQWRHLKNRMYLWHGSKVSNMMSILNQGLRVAPSEASSTGARFGKGIYFADMFEKAYSYSQDYVANREKIPFKTVFLCEVALGEKLELDTVQYVDELDRINCLFPIIKDLIAQYKSVLGRGRKGPNMEQQIVLVNGAKVPIGDIINYEYWRKGENGESERVHPECTHNEYIVYDISQVRMRYIIQVHCLAFFWIS